MTPLKTTLGIVIIICLTIVIFTFINRGKLCELSIKSEQHEVAAKSLFHQAYIVAAILDTDSAEQPERTYST